MGECMWRACSRLKELCQRDKPPPGSPSPPAPPPPPPPPDTPALYSSRWAFESRRAGELSFPAGAQFTIISRDGDWWSAQMIDGNRRVLGTGLVPGNYLEPAKTLEAEPWYFGTMNRLEARRLLLAVENSDGAFMVRHSDKNHIGHVLSVRSGSQVKHFKILQTEASLFFVEDSHRFASLLQLLQHYNNNPLSSCGMLGNPCRRVQPKAGEPPLPDDGWNLPKDEFVLQERLGGGYFADVHRGRWRNLINVAIKIIKSDTEMNHQEFQREVQILKSLRHRHLISLFAVCTDSAPYYIITELMQKGSLLSFLRGPEGQQQEVMSLIDMGAQVADGMSYLEEQNSIHRDLAARNVLVGEDYICKVADFGLARIIKEPFYITEDKKIPFKWSAPEAISHGKFSIKSDVWSFGVLLYEIITYGGIPYPALSNAEVYQQVATGYRMPAPPTCPDFLYQSMLACWSAEPDQRPAFSSLRAKLESSYECTSSASGGQQSASEGDSDM